MNAQIIRSLTIGLFITFASIGGANAQDLLKSYGTDSIECAENLFEAIQASQSKRQVQALEHVTRALEHDDACEMAHYWHSLILLDSGRVEEAQQVSMALIQRALENRGPRELVSNIIIEAAIDMGISHGRSGKLSESDEWLSKAIILAGKSHLDQQGKAYRNLAITAQQMGERPRSALLALKARSLAPNLFKDNMVADFIVRAEFPEWFAEVTDVDDLIGALVLYNELDTPQIRLLDSSTKRSNVVKPAGTGALRLQPDVPSELLLPDTIKPTRFLTLESHTIILSDEQPYCVSISDTGAVHEYDVGAPVSAVTADSNKILLAAKGANRVDIFAIGGDHSKSIQLKAPVNAMALCPHTGLLFYINQGIIFAHDLETGDDSETGMRGHALTIHPTSKKLYTLLKPERSNSESTRGHILINGRPIFFESTGSSRNFEYQDGLFLYAYENDGAGSLLCARSKVAVNTRGMDLSSSGDSISVAGGGGYRPGSGVGGYGVAVFEASSLEKVQAFYACEAYPQVVAFSPDERYIAIGFSEGLALYRNGAPHEAAIVEVKLKGDIAWSPDSDSLFVRTAEDKLQIYNVEN